MWGMWLTNTRAAAKTCYNTTRTAGFLAWRFLPRCLFARRRLRLAKEARQRTHAPAGENCCLGLS